MPQTTLEELLDVKSHDDVKRTLKLMGGVFTVALLPLPYEYYTFHRVVVCGLIYILFKYLAEARKEYRPFHFTFLGLFLIYNPIIPIHLGDQLLWIGVNIVTLVVLYYMAEDCEKGKAK
jgi:hypothetical protein